MMMVEDWPPPFISRPPIFVNVFSFLHLSLSFGGDFTFRKVNLKLAIHKKEILATLYKSAEHNDGVQKRLD
jgi:hypothetical protein